MALSSVDDSTPGSNVSERIAIVHNLFVGIDAMRWNGVAPGSTFAMSPTDGAALGADVAEIRRLT